MDVSVMGRQSRRLFLMGTVIDLTVAHADGQDILDEMERRLIIYQNRFSANDPESELMAVNQAAGKKAVQVHPELYQLIQMGKAHSQAPDSNMNIALGPLVQSWRIGFPDAKVPSPQIIQASLTLTQPQKIHLNDQGETVFLESLGMAIDLGCLAKGFIADLLIDYLKQVGVKEALINLGGNIVGLGGQPWRIGIQNPFQDRDQYLAVLKIRDHSIVTSGIYERKFEWQGKTYHHIFDKDTGYPIETDLASLTILSDKSVDGEIWTSRLFGKSVKQIMQTVDQLEGIEAMVVSNKQEIIYSKGINQFL